MLKKLGDALGSSGASPHLLALQAELAEGTMQTLAAFALGDLAVEIRQGRDSVWAIILREGCGGLALRTAYIPGGGFSCEVTQSGAELELKVNVRSPMGDHCVAFRDADPALGRLRATVAFTPAAPLSLAFVPRDIYPLDTDLNPLAATGAVEAVQRGLNSGLAYFRLSEPAFGSTLYFQNLTALNDYCSLTDTKPDGVVGGEWPELGYRIPVQAGDGTVKPLPAGREIVISDAILVIRPHEEPSETGSARRFLQMLAAVYNLLDRPTKDYRDWVARAERTLADLDASPKATLSKYGARYARPYTDAEYPDSMVQMSLLTAMHDYGAWRGEAHPLEASFRKGLSRFYDRELQCVRRYLPDVGDDKDADAVDSWYLYHPLLNLAYLALSGDKNAANLLLKSVDFGIKAAHHFKYRWPIQYNVRDFSVITPVAPADGRGQTDVGGIYAQLMLMTYQLTNDDRFLTEAKAAIDAAEGLRFNLNYQANLTAWGAAACLRLWRITGEERYLQQSYVYLASFFHNCEIWESELKHAAAYRNFLGVTCLQDAPYMAIYECFDSFAAFECYLRDSGPELDPDVRLLVSEYCKYALDRAWFYYPDALPEEVLATEQRNGHIDRKLSFPLEDLYADGQPAGQVGQEIYGAGAAWVFASRAFHHLWDAPFRLHCDHFIFSIERHGEHAVALQLSGDARGVATLDLVPNGDGKLPRFEVKQAGGNALKPVHVSKERVSYEAPGDAQLVLAWK